MEKNITAPDKGVNIFLDTSPKPKCTFCTNDASGGFHIRKSDDSEIHLCPDCMAKAFEMVLGEKLTVKNLHVLGSLEIGEKKAKVVVQNEETI